ncbi:hypothetical protein PILCRDRAFT_15806 [Piloderma croceum F 1598]|uniref:Uncharacterized protein n=1 Tax=Piloderma croceum (strain F 1598) TaxID=765440 RepID=A0A0C3B637_PILCF|nr:hypothetical protein PILCRDRAFT_15806 [Piloderma croceum F 1598]
MSYYYEDPEYNNYGNHSDKYDEYKSYSDHTELDHWEYEDANMYYYGDMDHKDVPRRSDQEHKYHNNGMGGAENRAEVKMNELGELKHKGDEGRTCELEELKYRVNKEEYEHKGLTYKGDKHGELVYEPACDAETHYVTYEPHRFEQNEGMGKHTHPHLYHLPIPVYIPPTHSFLPPPTHDNDNPQGFKHNGISEHKGPTYHNVRTTNGAFTPTQLIYHEELGEYVHPCFLAPAQILHHHNNPNPPLLSPTQNLPTPSPRNYMDINVLLQDIQDGDSEAIAYMVELNQYTEEHRRIKMERQINGDNEYSKKDSKTGLQQTQEMKDPKNNATPTKPPLANTPISPPPPSPTTLSNNTPTHTTPYHTSQSCPQPWPNKKRNKYHFGTRTPVGTTTK